MASLPAILGSGMHWLRPRRRRRRGDFPGRTWITSAQESTTFGTDGAVHSLQSARLELPGDEFKRLWTPGQLENLGGAYWRFLSRVTLGLIRVLYDEHERRVVLIAKPLTLLRFDAPRYSLNPDHGRISWAIRDGLLVSGSGRNCGFLAIDARRDSDRGHEADGATERVLIDVEVADYYPRIAAWLGRSVYGATQSFIHVALTHAYLRSLASLKVPRSSVRRFPE